MTICYPNDRDHYRDARSKSSVIKDTSHKGADGRQVCHGSMFPNENQTLQVKEYYLAVTDNTTRRVMLKLIFLTATAGSDVVQSGRPIFDDFFQHLWPYIGNNTANVVFQMVKRLWLIRLDQ
ncbi:hypothetical protein TNCV_2886591 [Trichonephila clavipes]|nr:hypothetical protein TNCV_2886591 [Trichonephila clavipes]